MKESPAYKRMTLVEDYAAVKLAVSVHGRKESILFANENNSIRYNHAVIHRVIAHLGGWDHYCKMIKAMDIETFERIYKRIWENIQEYPNSDHCIGLYEKMTGRCKKLINAKTNKHVFADGSSLVVNPATGKLDYQSEIKTKK